MNAPNGGKTFLDQKIERGQDINNTWTMVASLITRPGHEDSEEELFAACFPVVQRISAQYRGDLPRPKTQCVACIGTGHTAEGVCANCNGMGTVQG